MGGNTETFQYRGSGDLGPGPGTSGGILNPRLRGDLLQGKGRQSHSERQP